MSNIEKIRQEIERRINAYKTKNGFPAGTKCAIRIETYEGLLVFIDSLPEEKLSEVDLNTNVYNGMGGLPLPYLRPMSSMTEKEKRKYDILVEEIVYRPGVLTCSSLINFCYEHHLDDLGLIEKGLALEAPEGMYETE